MAAPSVRNSGTALFGTASTLAPVIPAHATDDILICCAASSANASVTPTHAISGGNWTDTQLIASAVITTGVTRSRISVWWIRATSGAETDPTVTYTPTGATACHHMAVAQSVQGCVTTGNPFENAQTNQAEAASSIGVTRTVSGADRLSFIAAHHADNVATAATEDRAEAYVQHYSTDSNIGIDGFTSIWSFGPLGSTSDTATMAFTSGGTGVGIAGLAFALLPAATVVDLTGTLAVSTTLAGGPAQDHLLANTLSAATTLSGVPTVEKLLSGTVAAVATLSGALDISIPLSGTLAVSSSLSGALVQDHLLAGTLAVTSTLQGQPGQDHLLTGTVAATATLSGAPIQDHLLANALQATMTLSGAPAVDGGVPTVNLSGTLEVACTLAGQPLLERLLSGSVPISASLSGNPLLERLLAGALFVQFSASGAIWNPPGPTYVSPAYSPADTVEPAGPIAVVGSLAGGPGNRDAVAKA